MYPVGAVSQPLPASASSSSSASASSSTLAPIERLAADAIINYILPYLFSRSTEAEYGDYFDGNTRAIFIASRNFSRLESHALKLRGDYLGDILIRSCYFDDRYKTVPGPAPAAASASAAVLAPERKVKVGAREIHPYFAEMFAKKVVSVSNVAFEASQKRKKAPAEAGLKLIESRLLFSALEVHGCDSITVEKIARVKRMFPLLRSVTLVKCRVTPKMIEALNEFSLLDKLELIECKSMRSSKERPYQEALNALQSLRVLHIKNPTNIVSGEEQLTLPKLEKLWLEQAFVNTFLVRAPRGALVDPLPMAFSSAYNSLVELVIDAPQASSQMSTTSTIPTLRRFKLQCYDGPFLHRSIVEFILRHLHLEDISVSISSPELIAALAECRQLKKLAINAHGIDLQPLITAGIGLESLDIASFADNYTYENWRQGLELMRQIRRLTSLTTNLAFLANLITPLDLNSLQLCRQSYAHLEELHLRNCQPNAAIISMLPWIPHLKMFRYFIQNQAHMQYLKNGMQLDAYVLLKFMRAREWLKVEPRLEKTVIECPFENREDQTAYLEQVYDAFDNERVLDIDIMDDALRAHLNDMVVQKALAHRPHLEELNLRGAVHFTDRGIREMRPLEKLREADLTGTQITHAGFAEFFVKCPQLEGLVASKSQGFDYKAFGAALRDAPHVRRLTLQGAAVSYQELESLFEGALLLRELDLSQVPIAMPKDKTLADLAALIAKSCKGLTKLWLRESNPPIPAITFAATELVLRELPELKELTVHGGEYTIEIAKLLSQFENLRSVHYCGHVDSWAVGYTALTRLDRRIKIHHGPMPSAIPGFSESMEALRCDTYLDLSPLQPDFLHSFTEEGLTTAIRTRPRLHMLQAAGVRLFTDQVLEAVYELEELESIDLSGTAVTAEGVGLLFESCPQLQHITLSYMPDFDKVIEKLQCLEAPRSLHILGGDFSPTLQAARVQKIVEMSPGISVLGLSHLTLDEEGVLKPLAKLGALSTLVLNHSTLSISAFDELVALTESPIQKTLRALDITHTKFPSELDFDFAAANSVARSLYDEVPERAVTLAPTKATLKKVFKARMPRCAIVEMSA